MSTGASQFTTIDALLKEAVDWQRVVLFHLDEYIGISPEHPASFVRYIKERFAQKVTLKAAFFVDTSEDVSSLIASLSRGISAGPIDVGLIGIGENAHIAFNDPPADFDDQSAYKIVTLTESCRRQQVREGWFKTVEEVPVLAVTATVRQILKCRHILSSVPYEVKAKAIHDTLASPDITNMIPATALRKHERATLYLDKDSASMISMMTRDGSVQKALKMIE